MTAFKNNQILALEWSIQKVFSHKAAFKAAQMNSKNHFEMVSSTDACLHPLHASEIASVHGI